MTTLVSICFVLGLLLLSSAGNTTTIVTGGLLMAIAVALGLSK